jgi:tripartite-type tricarboxylate transporter receptor subunit TctC
MKFKRLLLSMAVTLAATTSHAQSWPTRPITLIVPSAAGGSTDISARLIGEPLSKVLGQPVIVDNKPGAAGNLGTELVARAKPDGHTLLMQYSGYHVGNPALFPQIKWNPTKDFVPVALVMRAPHVVTVSAAVPAGSLQELIALGRKTGKGFLYASSGNGSIQHIAGELFAQQTHVPMTHIPYKGASPAINDLLGGQVDMFVTTPPSVIGHVGSGKLKALAYTGKQRHPSLPNVPTSAEAGLPAYEVESWFAVFAPAGTPPPVVERLSAEIKTIVGSDSYRKKMDDQGAFAAYMDSKALGSFVQSELELWSRVIKTGNIKPD